MAEKKQKRRIRIAIAVLLLLVIAFSIFATEILTPLRSDYGCKWRHYLREPEDSLDVLYLGTSIAYTDMVPAVLYDQTGLSSFSMAGPVQTMAESYYYLRETTRTQSPKLVMLEVTGLLLDNQPNYDLINIHYMPMGLNRVRCTLASAPAKDWIQYFFPLYVYHSRWDKISLKSIKTHLTPAQPDLQAGWTCLSKTKAFTEYEPKLETYTEASFQTGAEYLQKIVDYCKEENIQLLLCMSPRCNYMQPETSERLQTLLSSLDADFMDFDTLREQIGLDDQTDFYDSSHLNILGAEKFTRFLGIYLTTVYKLEPGNADAALWQKRVDRFEQLAAKGTS